MTARGLTIRYVLALGVIALMAASVLSVSMIVGRAASEDAGLVNMSGRQRMLSQRIVMLSQQMQTATTVPQRASAEQRLADGTELFARSHLHLVRAAQARPAIDTLYQGEPALDSLSLEFIDLADLVLRGDTTSISLRELGERGEAILPLLDDATNAFADAADARVLFMDRIETAAFAVTLLLLLVVGWFIFRPAVFSI